MKPPPPPSAIGLYWVMSAGVLAKTLGLPNSEGILPILREGELVGWYVRGRGILRAGEVW